MMTAMPTPAEPRVPAISASHRYLLETPHTVALATVGADGQPQVTAIWAMLDGDVVRTSLSKSRQKYKNLLAHPQVTLFVIDPQNPFRTLEVRATAEIADDPGLEFLQRLLQLYGTDLDNFPAPTHDRVVITLNPTRIVENG
jgi:PPOX class probable F420-dependent enzyme